MQSLKCKIRFNTLKCITLFFLRGNFCKWKCKVFFEYDVCTFMDVRTVDLVILTITNTLTLSNHSCYF